MPNIDFVLPHWLYWLGLLVFPAVAMVLVRKSKVQNRRKYQKKIAYFIWLVGGFLGLHWFYLRSYYGIVFWGLFAAILYCTSLEGETRVFYSEAVSQVKFIEKTTLRNQKTLLREKKKNDNLHEELQIHEELQTIDKNSPQYNRKVNRAQKSDQKIQNLQQKINDASVKLQEKQKIAQQFGGQYKKWGDYSFYIFILVLILMTVDLFLIPKWTDKANDHIKDENNHIKDENNQEQHHGAAEDEEFVCKKGGVCTYIDKLSLYSGEFVAYWSIIAVFVYYYEVTVRYVFNSPTNWAHESMFLMFGMQYLIAGSYAYLTNKHVRVDIFYAKFSQRGKAIVDIMTSVFFFIFAGTLLATGLIFAFDSLEQYEVSFTEWAIQYWPVKFSIVFGALLLLLQGISKLLKDIEILFKSHRSTG